MEQNIILKNSNEIVSPLKSDIPLSSVRFSKSWTFWESYISKSINLSYEEANKEIFKWSDIITFFQFWNKYPGNNIKNIFFDGNNIKYFFNENYRINSMNIFIDGIKPMWEDPKNKGGKCLQLEYKIQKEKMDDFSIAANYQWKKLALCTMGMSIPGADYINGIRFIDKTNFDKGNIIMFRIEIWVEKNIKNNILEELIDFLKKNLGCEKIIIKKIES
jgi:translation initiation factor 4E